jgi:hypothetical protein
MKVRYKIRVVSGPRAKEIDARQAKAIMELLEWARQHRTQQANDRHPAGEAAPDTILGHPAIAGESPVACPRRQIRSCTAARPLPLRTSR